MSELLIGDYLNKILLLEERVGAKVGYHSFQPFSLSLALRDPVALNNAARTIADFVAIKDLVIVSRTVHSQDRAGQIDLGNTRDGVFIEIAEDILDFPHSVLATMAHEISHRYLQVHSISCGWGPAFDYHNEILTDITAVFLGLGKLMLNGCIQEKTHQETKNGQVQTLTQIKTVGYLEPEQLTFVYLVVCAMRNIPPEEYESGLLPEAIGRVRECRSTYANGFFSQSFHRSNIWDELQARSDQMKSDALNKLNLLGKRLSQFEKGYVATVSTFLATAQEKVAGSGPHFPPIPYDPALTFLLAVKANLELSLAINDIAHCSKETERHITMLTQLLAVAEAKEKAKRKLLDSWKHWFQRRNSKPPKSPSI